MKYFPDLQTALDWALQELIDTARDDPDFDPDKLADLLTLQASNPSVGTKK